MCERDNVQGTIAGFTSITKSSSGLSSGAETAMVLV